MINFLLKILVKLLRWAGSKEKVKAKLDLNKNDTCDLIEWADWIEGCIE